MLANQSEFYKEWRETRPIIEAFFRKKGFNDNDLEDLVQETACRACLAFNSYDAKKGVFKNWILTISNRVNADYWRKHQPYQADQTDDLIDHRAHPESEAIATMHLDSVECELTKKSIQMRQEGLTFKAIADKLNISRAKVHRLLKKLREENEEVEEEL